MIVPEVQQEKNSEFKKLVEDPNKIRARVWKFFNLPNVDLDKKNLLGTKVGSVTIVTEIYDLPDHIQKIVNKGFKDGIVFEEGGMKGKPRSVATYERTIKDKKVTNFRYACEEIDDQGNLHNITLSEENVENDGPEHQNRQMLPPKITVYPRI